MEVIDRLLFSLQEKGVRLWIAKGELHFHAPEGLLTADQISFLRERKNEIVANLDARQTQTTDSFALTARKQAVPAPLTYQQELMWAQRGSPIWVVGLRLSGAVDTEILCRSLATLVRRHAAMRTRFVLINDTPHQVSDPPGEYRLDVMPLDGATEQDVNTVVRRFTSEMGERWRAMPSGVLFEARLIRTGESRHALLVAISCLIADMVAVDLLFKELWNVYGQLSRGMSPSLSHLPLQYSDFAVWQREASQQQLAPHRDYWSCRLSGATRLRFPSDSGLQGKQPLTFAALPVALSEALSSALHAIARRERTTAAMVMLSVFIGAASDWCRQRDFMIEFNVNGRRQSDLVNVIGRFFELLPLRIQLSGDETFIELLRLVSQEFVTAYEHVEFVNIARTLPGLYDTPGGARCQLISGVLLGLVHPSALLARDESRLPFSVEHIAVGDVSTSSEFEAADCYMAEVRLPMFSTSHGMEGRLLYRADLFKRSTMQRFLRQYRLLIERIVQNPHTTLVAFDRVS